MGSKKQSRPAQLNKFMHSRNPYKVVSFKQLAISYPEFRTHCTYDVSGKIYLDFKKTESLKALTTTLLHKDYGLKVSIPENRLIPTLPLRMNYILWIEDLLTLTHGKAPTQERPIIGFDVGTGATCVYPLIGSKKNGWHFIATEMDDVSFESAKENVSRNDLEGSILVKKSSKFLETLSEQDVHNFVKIVRLKEENATTSPILNDGKRIQSEDDQSSNRMSHDTYLVDFTMCNPPFFSSEAEMRLVHCDVQQEACNQRVSYCVGSTHERVTEGGEMAFIIKMIDESFHFKNRVRIFSSLIGKKHDVKPIIKYLKEKAGSSFVCITETEFCQGRTMRWGVAWSFDPALPLSKVLSKKQKLTQKPMLLHIPRSLMSSYSVKTVWSKIQLWLKEIKIKPQLVTCKQYFVSATIRAYKPTWLHLRQKRRKKLTASKRDPKTDGCDGTGDLDVTHVKKGTQEEEEQQSEDPPEKKPRLDERNTSPAPSRDHAQQECGELAQKELRVAAMGTPLPSIKNLKPPAEKEIQDGDLPPEPIAPTSQPSEKSPSGKSSSGPECLLRAFLTLKQAEAVITLEVKYLSGTGNKDTVNQLLQYLKNRMVRED